MRSSRDSAVTRQQRTGSGWRLRKEAGSGTDVDRSGGSPLSEEDSGILDVEDEEEDEVSDGDVLRFLNYFSYVSVFFFSPSKLLIIILNISQKYITAKSIFK